MAPGSHPRRSPRHAQDDSRVDSSTPQRGTPASTRLANIPKQAIEEASDSLRRNILPNDSDEKILKALKHVQLIVEEALEHDPELKKLLASKEEFRQNVTRKGEKLFIDSLRAMAGNSDAQGSKAWEDLFQDGTFFSFGPSILIVFSP
jgi:glycyl-tRNA synthetase beta subunit